jgi:signal transduction histidine kinase
MADRPKVKGFRWPIRLQLLVPMVGVVLLASFLATATTAGWLAVRVRNEQEENLRRLVRTLGEASFPLTGPVLTQVKGLSGAELLLIRHDGRVEQSTLPAKPIWLEDVARIARPARGQTGVREATVSLAGRDYLVDLVHVPGGSAGTRPSTLWVLYPENQVATRVREAVYPAITAGLVAAVIAVAIATWVSRRLARPIGTLVGRTATIARGDFTPMAVARRNDELRDLAESINRMAEQLADYERQVRRHERLKTLGQLGSSMAHQLRNAATGGRMAIELHRRDCPRATSDESLDVALRQLRLMESYLRQFLTIEATAPAVCQRVDVGWLAAEVLSLVRPSYVHAGIELEFTPPPKPLLLRGDPEALRQLLTNLVLNAAEAAVTGKSSPPRVWVDLIASDDGSGSLCVRDTGPGPDPAVRDRLFESLATTKPDGAGLGLFVAREIADRHRGRLYWRRDGETTCFCFEFPLEPSWHTS